jgi:hypothetical protein
MQDFKNNNLAKFNKKEQKNTENILKKDFRLNPLLENQIKKISQKSKAGRPGKDIQKIIEDFKKDVISFENIKKDPLKLSVQQLIKNSAGKKEHWFHTAKHLHLRIKNLSSSWYDGKNSILYYLLVNSKICDRTQALYCCAMVKKASADHYKKIKKEERKQQMKDINNRKELSEKIKLLQKNPEFRKKNLEGIEKNIKKFIK